MRTQLLSAFLLSAAFLPAQGAPATATRIDLPTGGTTVPMLDLGGRPMVEVRINGKGPYALLVDTGANVTVIDETFVKELGVDVQSNGTFQIDELRLGDVVVHGFQAHVFRGGLPALGGAAPLRGILSAAAFAGNLVVLDYPQHRVTIKPGALPAADDQRVFEYHPDEELPVIPVTIAGHVYRIHMDSGAPSGVTLPTKYASELPLVAPPVEVGHARTQAGTFPVSLATLNGTIAIGAYLLELKDVKFSDLRPGAEPGIGNVGGEVLRGFIVTFDAKNRRVKLERPAA
jgi:hypothetical protein